MSGSGFTAPATFSDPPLLDLHPEPSDFLGEVIAGLSAEAKTLPYKYFYDARGSALFDRICELEEYYPTRTEMSIMESSIGEISAALGPQILLIEFGSGSSLKTRILLDHLDRPVAYVPIDISCEHLMRTARELQSAYPRIEILPLCADYTSEYRLPAPSRAFRQRVVYFPGSTIGNFKPAMARVFLKQVASVVGDGGGLLLGFDLEKDVAVLEAAYNDSQGVTAEFNLNLLRRINRELGADFDLEGFEHRALYNPQRSRIELFLISRRAQTVHLAGHTFDFAAGERIHTENSHKYTVDAMRGLAADAGFEIDRLWTDPKQYFGIAFMTLRGA